MLCVYAICRMQEYYHKDVMRERLSLYALLLFLVVVDVELITVLPWRNRDWDGYPTERLLLLVTVIPVLEEYPYHARTRTPAADPQHPLANLAFESHTWTA